MLPKTKTVTEHGKPLYPFFFFFQNLINASVWTTKMPKEVTTSHQVFAVTIEKQMRARITSYMFLSKKTYQPKTPWETLKTNIFYCKTRNKYVSNEQPPQNGHVICKSVSAKEQWVINPISTALRELLPIFSKEGEAFAWLHDCSGKGQ